MELLIDETNKSYNKTRLNFQICFAYNHIKFCTLEQAICTHVHVYTKEKEDNLYRLRK